MCWFDDLLVVRSPMPSPGWFITPGIDRARRWWDNVGMSNNTHFVATQAADIDPQVLADSDAVMKHLIDGTPIDPETARRIHERAAKITEEIRRVHGEIDDETFAKLIHDDDDDEP